MILLNFAHPLTAAQVARIEALSGQNIDGINDVAVQFDEQQPFEPQLQRLFDAIPLPPEAWQSEPLLVLLPSLNFIAALLLAELHGRMGYFPTIVRLRPQEGTRPRRYEAAELLDLQSVREAARRRR